MAGMPYPPNKRGAVETTAPPGDSGGIQTHDLQNRNLTLYSAKLRDPLFCRPFLRLYDIETEVDCKITAFI